MSDHRCDSCEAEQNAMLDEEDRRQEELRSQVSALQVEKEYLENYLNDLSADFTSIQAGKHPDKYKAVKAELAQKTEALEKLAKREPGDFCDCDLIASECLGYNPRKPNPE